MSERPTTSKGTRLVQFLEALVSLRSKTIQNIDSYEQVLSLDRIPNEPECFSRHRDSSHDDPDLWLEIRKPQEQRLPSPPADCLRWIGDWDRNDFENAPELRDTILAPVPENTLDDAGEDDSDDYSIPDANSELYLKDHPKTVAAWQHYMDSEWKPWAVERHRWHGVQTKYTKLFDIYSHMQTRGEQVELVLAIGLLSWRFHGTTIRRHLITARVDLTFDADHARFSIRPHSAGAQLRPEVDMLPPEARPPSIEITAQDGLRSADDDIWDRGTIDSVLKSIAHCLSDQGVFLADDDVAEQVPSENPVVQLAPMVILRRRSERSVHQFLKRIREQVSAGGDAPPGWCDLSENSRSNADLSSANGHDEAVASAADAECYFPLLANDEQRRILKALDHPIGALVQGPPGTGKSHTIANLICHLLATGKRILITAQTPRALQVLKEKLPPEIRPLVVSLLGSGVEEQQSLEESVQGITTKFDTANPSQNRQKAAELAGERGEIEKRIATLLHQRRSIRDRDTMVQSLPGYNGTAEQIAKAIAADAERFSWFEDEVSHDDLREVPADALDDALRTLRRLWEADRERLGKNRPVGGTKVPSPQKFAASVETERTCKATIEPHDTHELARASSDPRDLRAPLRAAIEAMENLDVAISNASARPQPWLKTALYEVLTKQDRPWFELHSATEEALAGIRELAREEDRRTLNLPTDLDWAQVKADANTLRQHLLDGHKLRLWFLKPAPIKGCRYLTTEVRVDGQLCANVESLGALIQHASLHLGLALIWKIWDGKARPASESLAIQTQEIEELQEALDEVLDAYRSAERTMEAIAAIPGLAEPVWHSDESRTEALQSLQLRVARIDLACAVDTLDRLCDSLTRSKASGSADRQSIDELLTAVEERDADGYRTAFEHILQLDRDATDLVDAEYTLGDISEWPPHLARAIGEHPTSPDWDTRLPELGRALDHARAVHWLHEFLDKGNLNEIEKELDRCEEKRRRCLTKEAELLAWAHSFDRMEESHRRALVAWQQATKAIGKGTGKYAPRHRREAQRQLHKCRPAIPAWIMPLHRVFDSIDPQPGMFDVIIVDEASQCGPDALPLFYIGQKVLIVGDDKQISPSHVGINREHVHQRMREYLGDFEHKGSFDLEKSLFDHGELRISNRIVLREHFRCMPEIIRFSNDLCYVNTPLIPLRQYPPNRLDPLLARHVSEGFRDGSGSNVLNKPEAKRLADAVSQCCNDPRYTREGVKLTFGVISLQGWKQAEYIEHLLLHAIGAEEMAQRRLVCGDAYSFQGDERDVIFLSMVAAPNARLSAMTRFADQQRFNVAASRARDQLWLFHSVLPKDLGEKCVRRRLLEHFLDPARSARDIAGIDVERLEQLALRANRTTESPPDPFESWFEVDVALRIAARRMRVVPQMEAGGYRIDLIVEGHQSRLAIECDGDHWHGPERYEDDLARQRKLERAGWTFERVRGCEFYANPGDAMQPVWDRLEELGIREPDAIASDSGTSREEELSEPPSGELEEEPATGEPHPPLGNQNDEGTPSAQVPRDNSLQVTPQPQSSIQSLLPLEGELGAVAPPQSEPYKNWTPAPMGDPRQTSADVVMKGLLSIIEVEGPILASRAYGLYANAAGLHRVGSTLRDVFNKAVSKARYEGLLELEQTGPEAPISSAILRLAGSPDVCPRTRGDRTFGELPPSEIAWFMQRILDEQPAITDDQLYHHILDHYDLRRLRGPTRDRLVDIHLSILDHGDSED